MTSVFCVILINIYYLYIKIFYIKNNSNIIDIFIICDIIG